MTEELKRKAKKWVKDNTRIEHSASFGDIEVEPSAEKGYIVGATENGIQWHDLRKDPNDLPKSSPFHEVLNENGMKMYYDDVLKKWNMFTQNGIVQARPPIVWCEIPQFKE